MTYEFPYNLLPMPLELSYYDPRTSQILRIHVESSSNLVGILSRFNKKDLDDLHDIFSKLIEQTVKEVNE